jgi:hypothetical protein
VRNLKYISIDQFQQAFESKKLIGLDDLVQLIEEQFNVLVSIEHQATDIDVKKLANDKDLIRQIKSSYEDIQAGRVYSDEEGIEYMRRKSNGD